MLKNTLLLFGLLFCALSLSAQVEMGPKSGSYASIVSPQFLYENESALFYIYREDISTAYLIKVRRSDLKVESHTPLALNPLEKKMEGSIQNWIVKDSTLLYFALYNYIKEDYKELWVHQLDLNTGKSKSRKALKRSDYKKYYDQITLDAWYLPSKNQFYVFEYNKPYKKGELKESLSLFDADFQEIRSIQFDSENGAVTSVRRPLFDAEGSVYFSGVRGIIHLDVHQDFAATSIRFPEDLVEGPEYLMQLTKQWMGENGQAYFLYAHKKMYSKMHVLDVREQKSEALTEGIYILAYDPLSKQLQPAQRQPLAEGSMPLFNYLGFLARARTAELLPSSGETYPEYGFHNDVSSLSKSSGISYFAMAYSPRTSGDRSTRAPALMQQYDRFLFALDQNNEILWHKTIDYISKGSGGQNIHQYDGYYGFCFFEEGAYLGLLYNEREGNIGIDSYEDRKPMDDPEEAIPVVDRIDPANGAHSQLRLDGLLDPTEANFALDVSSFVKSEVDGQFYFILSNHQHFKVARTASLLSEE